MAISQWVSVVENGFKLMGILFLVVGTVLGFILPSEVGIWIKATFLAAIIFSLLAGILIGGYIFRKISHNRDTPLGYRVISEVYDYRFDNNDPRLHFQTLTRVVEARRSSVSMIEYRYLWTGQGEGPKISILNGCGDILDNAAWIQNRYRIFYVRLHRPIVKGEYRKIGLNFIMNDSAGTFRPFFVKTVSEYIREIRLIVRFSEKLTLKNDQISAYKSSVTNENNRHSFPYNWDESSLTASLEVRSPRRNDIYGIEWDWDYSSVVESVESHGREAS